MKTNNRFVIITGLSGAGKSTLSGIFEDLGYFCVDNLPTTLIPKFAEICLQSGGKISKFALVVDVREKLLLRSIESGLNDLAKHKINYEIVYLEASEEALVRRYSETRRRHPLDEGDLIESIRRERKILKPLRNRAQTIIDTSDLNIWALKERIFNLYGERTSQKMPITIVTFGYKFGIPIEADLVIDLRFLPNPYYEERLKKLDGHNHKVKRFILKNRITTSFLKKLCGFLEYLLPNYQKTGKPYLVIGLGCTGGRHRSVVIGEHLAQVLRRNNRVAKVVDRDMKRHD